MGCLKQVILPNAVNLFTVQGCGFRAEDTLVLMAASWQGRRFWSLSADYTMGFRDSGFSSEVQGVTIKCNAMKPDKGLIISSTHFTSYSLKP